MKHYKTITALVFLITVMAAAASTAGIYSKGGKGPYHITSVRGDTVPIYGKGIYRHMSMDVAPQGIAQDYVTLFIGIPLLLLTWLAFRKGSLKGRFLLTGILGYFLATYLFYLVMGMYNALFLVYVSLLSASFFAFILMMFSFDIDSLPETFRKETPVLTTGGFLIFNCVAIAVMWLKVVIPPLFNGKIIPEAVEHYTTLIVQGLDLALLLPVGILAGVLFIKRRPFGFLLAPVYFVFLSLLMCALTAKVIAMAWLGQDAVPAIIIIPAFGIIAIICTLFIFNSIKDKQHDG